MLNKFKTNFEIWQLVEHNQLNMQDILKDLLIENQALTSILYCMFYKLSSVKHTILTGTVSKQRVMFLIESTKIVLKESSVSGYNLYW